LSDFRIRIKGFETKPASAFKFNPLNWRRHGEVQREALRTMLGDVGWVQGVIENVRTGNLIDGHARIEEALRDDPNQAVPYLVVDLSRAEEKAILATFDPIGAMAESDPEALRNLYQETVSELPALEQLLTGLHIAGGGKAPAPITPADALVPPARAAALVKQWRVKPGDVWALGYHRLKCGDCRSSDQVAALLKREKINVAVSAPPGVEEFAPVAANVARHLAPDGSWFLKFRQPTNGGTTALTVARLVVAHVREWGWYFATEFCWQGEAEELAHRGGFQSHFASVYQFARARWKIRPEHVRHSSDAMIIPIGKGAGQTTCLGQHGAGSFFRPEQVRHFKTGSSAVMSSLQGTNSRPGGLVIEGWAYPGNRLPAYQDDGATGHQAEFPAGLPAFFIEAFSDPGEVVFDPFVGSGSTLVAAEQTARRGFAMEASAAGCAITLERMARAFPKLRIRKLDQLRS
jgi:hypothetical protein